METLITEIDNIRINEQNESNISNNLDVTTMAEKFLKLREQQKNYSQKYRDRPEIKQQINEKNKNYYFKIKEDPEKYALYLEKKRLYKQKVNGKKKNEAIEKIISEEQKEEQLEEIK